MDRVLNFLRKIPFGLLSALCVMFTYLVAGTIGLLIVPMLLCVRMGMFRSRKVDLSMTRFMEWKHSAWFRKRRCARA